MKNKTSAHFDQKEQIQLAALTLFSEKGYSGVTVAEIATQAGVNPATIYRFFNGKKELFQALERPDLDFPDSHEQANRDLILQTAIKIFSQKGFASATMDDIAEAVGLSKAGVYFYFPSKESLFSAAVENPTGFAWINSALNSFLVHEDSDLEKGLVKVAMAYLSLFKVESFVSLLKIILSEGVRNPKIAGDFKQKIVLQGSRNMAGFLTKFCDLEPEILMLKIQTLFGMLLSWGLMNYLLQEENALQEFDLDRS